MPISEPCVERNSNPSISSAAAIPVNPLAWLASGVEKTMRGIFGPSSHEFFAFSDPDSPCWRTCQATLFSGSDEFSGTWPDSGSMRNGRVYGLLTSAPLICEREFSLWPTAVAQDDQKTPEAHLRMKQRMGERDGTNANRTVITSLAVKVQAWPTPRQEDGESCGNHPGSGGDSLTGVTRNWPTPNQHDSMGARGPGFSATDRHYRPHDLNSATDTWRMPDAAGEGGPRNRQGSMDAGHQITIAEQAEHWTTPTSTERSGQGERNSSLRLDVRNWKTPHGMSNRDFRGKMGGCGGGEFAKQANLWQTPATDSFRSRSGDRKDEMGLDQQARLFPTPNARDYRTPNKRSYQERSETSKGEQLQNFVEHSLLAPEIPDGGKLFVKDQTWRQRLVVAWGRVLSSF